MTILRRLALGISSLAALLILVLGIPWALLVAGVAPFAHGLPTWDEFVYALTSRDNGTFILGLFTVVAWVGWAILMVALLLEVVARARRVQAPRMPGFGLPQLAAKHLISGVLLLFMAPGLAHAAPTESPTPVTQTAAATYAQATPRHPRRWSSTTPPQSRTPSW